LAAKFVEPGEEQADPAKFVDPLFEERDQNLAVENGEEQGVRCADPEEEAAQPGEAGAAAANSDTNFDYLAGN
jgi:hypothetical protein